MEHLWTLVFGHLDKCSCIWDILKFLYVIYLIFKYNGHQVFHLAWKWLKKPLHWFLTLRNGRVSDAMIFRFYLSSETLHKWNFIQKPTIQNRWKLSCSDWNWVWVTTFLKAVERHWTWWFLKSLLPVTICVSRWIHFTGSNRPDCD